MEPKARQFEISEFDCMIVNYEEIFAKRWIGTVRAINVNNVRNVCQARRTARDLPVAILAQSKPTQTDERSVSFTIITEIK